MLTLVVAYRVVECFDDQLQSDLRELEQWANDWGMQVNTSKCHVLSIDSQSSHHHQHFYELCSVVLKSVESEKYLGVTLSSNLSFFKSDFYSPGTDGRHKRGNDICTV